MKNITLQIVGIDMAYKTFDVCFKERGEDGRIRARGNETFDNCPEGFKKYLQWFKRRKGSCPLIHLMEATGVYHENLCYFLDASKEQVSVQLAQKAKHFIKSLNIKTKTDKVDASALAEMGFSRKLELWQPVCKDFRAIRYLSRTMFKLRGSRSATISQLHAMRSAHNTFSDAITVMEELLEKENELMARCEERILELVSMDTELQRRVERIAQVKGIRAITIIKVLAETDGFRSTGSIRSLVSYSGLDVVQNQSGSKEGRTRISKKGNPYIRAALYMPALCASRFDPKSKRTYDRLTERLPKKRQATTAVMRKLLITIYTLWNNGEEYDPDHQWKKGGRAHALPQDSPELPKV